MDGQDGDKTLICIDCNDEFTFTKRDQDFYKVHGYVEPKRCYPCRKKKKSRFENKTTQVYVGDKTYPKVDGTKI